MTHKCSSDNIIAFQSSMGIKLVNQQISLLNKKIFLSIAKFICLQIRVHN